MKRYIKCDNSVDCDALRNAIKDAIKDIEIKQKNEEEHSPMWYYYEGIKDGYRQALFTITDVKLGD